VGKGRYWGIVKEVKGYAWLVALPILNERRLYLYTEGVKEGVHATTGKGEKGGKFLASQKEKKKESGCLWCWGFGEMNGFDRCRPDRRGKGEAPVQRKKKKKTVERLKK